MVIPSFVCIASEQRVFFKALTNSSLPASHSSFCHQFLATHHCGRILHSQRSTPDHFFKLRFGIQSMIPRGTQLMLCRPISDPSLLTESIVTQCDKGSAHTSSADIPSTWIHQASPLLSRHAGLEHRKTSNEPHTHIEVPRLSPASNLRTVHNCPRPGIH